MQCVTVLGGGSFGTAMAQLLAQQGQEVLLWMRNGDQVAHIQKHRRNPNYLQEFVLDSGITAIDDLDDAVRRADWVFVCVPSGALRETCTRAAHHLHNKPILLGCKGIEDSTLMTPAEVVVDVLGPKAHNLVMALSGPSFAKEIMEGKPTAVVLAGRNMALTERVAGIFFCDTFRPYINDDIIGVEMGGAMKNVMAIAAGVATGMDLGDNARAAIITRGIAEIARMIVAKGGRPMTAAGLSGVGDMLLTCTGTLSRNRALGVAVGQGQSVAEALRNIKQVAEGYYTAKSAYALAQSRGIDAWITREVYQVLHENWPVEKAIAQLLHRPPGREMPIL